MKSPVKVRNPIAQLVKQAQYHKRVVEDKKKKAKKQECRRWNISSKD